MTSDLQRLTCLSQGERLDVSLAGLPGITRSRGAALIQAGCCTVSGRVVTKPAHKPAPGEEIVLTLPPPVPIDPQPENLPLTLLYEDDDLAVVNKPAGMVVHPAPGNESGTLVNALLHHLTALSGIGGALRPGIVHRLDKDTSGVLLVAKTDEAQHALSRQLAERQMEKHYLALVEGALRQEAGEVDAPIARSKTDRKKMAIDPAGRPAHTRYRVLARGNAATLLDVHILTGRTHQIRVHMRALGHPVCGDPLYGHPKGVWVPRLMLHAWRIAFTHPRTGAQVTFTAPPPDAFRRGLRGAGVDVAIDEGLEG